MTAQLPSRERLEKIASWREMYGAGHNVMLSAEEAEAMARALLAAHEQEPIGAFHISGGTVEATTDYCKDGEWPVQDGIVEVYTHPAPVPAVPAKWPEKLTWSHHDDVTQAEVLAWNYAIDACRSALVPVPAVSDAVSKLLNILDRHTVELGWCEPPISLAELVIARDGREELDAIRAMLNGGKS